MKKLPCIVAMLLGVAFIIFGVAYFVPAVKSILPAPTPPNGEEAVKLTQAFFGGLAGSGYLSVIKALEIVAGLLLIVEVHPWLGRRALGRHPVQHLLRERADHEHLEPHRDRHGPRRPLPRLGRSQGFLLPGLLRFG
jgi:hypothetical protein